MNFEDCLKEGLIKEKKEAVYRVRKSIEIALKFLRSAERNFEIQENETCVMVAYNSIFHSCRSLLFNKGYVEKSHFCLVMALKFLYKEDIKLQDFLNSIDKIRFSRHEIQYTGKFSNKDEAKFVLDLAKEFLNYVRLRLK